MSEIGHQKFQNKIGFILFCVLYVMRVFVYHLTKEKGLLPLNPWIFPDLGFVTL